MPFFLFLKDVATYISGSIWSNGFDVYDRAVKDGVPPAAADVRAMRAMKADMSYMIDTLRDSGVENMPRFGPVRAASY